MKPTKILYLQLPLLDNDAKNARENFPFAGAYLDYALQRCDEGAFYSALFSPGAWDELDTAHLVEAVLASGARIVAFTLYLWNIERALRVAALLKAADPAIKLVCGGPETAREHPLLFADSAFDAVVTGEGESVFPALLQAWRTGESVEFENLAQQDAAGWHWGATTAPAVDLLEAQPPEERIMECVDNRPVVYLETVRGCPLTCSYCRYYQLHTGLRFIRTEQVLARIRRFQALGAREIRFVDPTFNARPGFTAFLLALAALNVDHELTFFAEIRSDTLTEKQAQLMHDAHFTGVEVGVQSIDPEVLQNVTRPVKLEKIAAGLKALCEADVPVILDVMYGLPGQTYDDVKRSLEWGLSFGDSVQVQCMQTLVLPGTVLRAESETWGYVHDALPPYSIQQTAELSAEAIADIEVFLDEHPQLPADPVTPRFCGRRLSGLFKAQHRIPVAQVQQPVPGRCNRRALLIEGAALFRHRAAIADLLKRAITQEPDGLWQFVLVVENEEPLDLLEQLAETIGGQRSHLLDRFASAASFGLTVSRRLYVRAASAAVSADWLAAAEATLRRYFG